MENDKPGWDFPVKRHFNCYACEDKVELENGAICQECCEHYEHDHFICIDCGLEREPSDYYDEDYGQDR